MRLWFAILVLVSNVLLAHAELDIRVLVLTDEQEKNIVNVLKVTPDEEQKAEEDYYGNLMNVVVGGIEEIAKSLITVKESTTSTGGQDGSMTPSGGQEGSTTPSGQDGSTTPNDTTEKPADPTPAKDAEKKTKGDKDDQGKQRRKRAVTSDDQGTTTTTTEEPLPPLTTTLVLRSKKMLSEPDFSEPLEFFVSTEYEVINGEKLKDRADDIKSAIETKAEKLPKPLKLTITVVGQGLAAWAIVLIVIAVLLVVGAAGYFLITYFRKQRGNSF